MPAAAESLIGMHYVFTGFAEDRGFRVFAFKGAGRPHAKSAQP
jgi:hypothetical protein